MTAVQVTDIADLIGADADEFLMTNWQGLVDVDGDILKATKLEAEAAGAPITVYVERAVAKILVTVDPAITGTVEWVLDVKNTQTYWMRNPWMAVNANGSGNTVATEYTDIAFRYLHYAKDPNSEGGAVNANWHSWEAWAAHGRQGTAPTYKNPDFVFLPDDMSTVTWNATGESLWEYMVENTMEADQQYRDVTTSIILKAPYAPETSSLSVDGTPPVAIGAGTQYYVFYGTNNRYVFAASELQAEYVFQYNGGAPQWGTTSKNYSPAEVQTFMENINIYGGFVSGDFNAGLAESEQLRYDFAYFDGQQINYYRIPIKHFTDDEQPTLMAYGRFGVVRNNVYKLTLTSLDGPGAAEVTTRPPTPPVDPPGPEEPEGPDEEGVAWASYEINILPWTVRLHDVNAGNESGNAGANTPED